MLKLKDSAGFTTFLFRTHQLGSFILGRGRNVAIGFLTDVFVIMNSRFGSGREDLFGTAVMFMNSRFGSGREDLLSCSDRRMR